MKTPKNNSFHKLIHDIRNGLSPILMYAQLIAYNTDKTPENTATIKKSAKEIENRIKSLASLLDKADDSVR